MKKVYEIAKPFLSIILGALLLLTYMNLLGANGAALAFGIIAIVFSAYYLVAGVLSLVIGEKLGETARRWLEIVAVALFPLLFFVYRLLIAIGGGLGINGWILAILGMVSALALVVFLFVSALSKAKLAGRLATLAGVIFAVILILVILFDIIGDPIAFGDILPVELITNIVYGALLFPFLTRLSKKEDGKEGEGSAPNE